MKLSNLLKFNEVVIQCHDNPDADAIASGWGLYKYFEKMGKKVRFIYGGKFPVQKGNLVLMKDSFRVPIEYVKELDAPELLLTVDCQYGEGNVTKFDAKNIAVIDHHQVSGKLPELSEVRSNLGSCSTLVWDLLREEGIDANSDPDFATAFYYGLMTDTNNFAEISHPLDRDMREDLDYRRSSISLFRNSNLSKAELKIAGEALGNSEFNEQYNYGVVESKPCDPNILGVISDMLLEVQGVNTCLVYSVLPFGVKLSIRSCIKEVKASELADFICEGLGSGGGHLEKAGGFLQKELMDEKGIEYTPEAINGYLKEVMNRYFSTSEIIYAKDYVCDISETKRYQKKRIFLGYVDPKEMGALGSTVTIRTIEGDMDVELTDQIYIMLGVVGEVYFMKKATFERSYEYSDEPYEYTFDYSPTVKDVKTGEVINLVSHIKGCYSVGTATIVGKQIDHRVKVFTSWDEEKYYLGKPGDFLVARDDNPNDVYIVQEDIFYRTYEEIND